MRTIDFYLERIETLHKSYYEILEVNHDASVFIIKKSYRKLAKQYHPDVNKSSDAAELFKLINEAYETLNDLKKREIYDLALSLSNITIKHFESEINGDLSFIDKLFEEDEHSIIREEKSTVLNVKVDFLDVIKGAKTSVSFDKKIKCDVCDGSGISSKSKVCKDCLGEGKIIRYKNVVTNNFTTNRFQEYLNCPSCDGLGFEVFTECSKCQGNGVLLKNTSVNFEIPQGYNKREIILKNQGHYISNLETDLIINLDIQNDTNFERFGDDLLIVKHYSDFKELKNKKYKLELNNIYGEDVSFELSNREFKDLINDRFSYDRLPPEMKFGILKSKYDEILKNTVHPDNNVSPIIKLQDQGVYNELEQRCGSLFIKLVK